ncbi:Protein of unknown function [Lactobacillus gigeriorum DSM 23908 = CRBIP 24.85]|uniref:Uncharacterized protein n=1 Tax=Lactobacillus gigeriorum DSM 23908 = CRBIP 24.85 TaxID=1423751 RepID=I7LDD8_9LACO|nr:Protein of unknown function [Lactobacillus gigeriorum DSM 23908 = CRBIP 24.85]
MRVSFLMGRSTGRFRPIATGKDSKKYRESQLL